MQTPRIKWLDIMKCLGIFAIYLGHFGPSAGYSYDFVFSHHVALFFFAAGCTEAISRDSGNIISYVSKRIKAILLPYFVFALFSIVVYALTVNAGTTLVLAEIDAMLKGAIRNTFCAGGLWFLTCLFVVQVIFIILKKVNYKSIILVISLLIFFAVQHMIVPSPIVAPRFVYNIDSALYFFPFYVLGYVLFPGIQLFLSDLKKFRVIIMVFTAISFTYSVLLFFQKDLLIPLDPIPILGTYTPIMRALLIIWLYIIVSRCLQNNKTLNSIGRNTLYLCGSEYLAKTGISAFLGIAEVSVTISYPLSAYVYSAFLIYIANRFLVPIEKKIMNRITKHLFLKSSSKVVKM